MNHRINIAFFRNDFGWIKEDHIGKETSLRNLKWQEREIVLSSWYLFSFLKKADKRVHLQEHKVYSAG